MSDSQTTERWHLWRGHKHSDNFHQLESHDDHPRQHTHLGFPSGLPVCKKHPTAAISKEKKLSQSFGTATS